MDSCTDVAPAAEMETASCGTHLRARFVGTLRAASAGWRIAPPAAMAISEGHRYNQIKFPPRMGPPSCSTPV